MKPKQINREELEDVRAWALSKIATGEEPPWGWYQLMKLREALDAILSGMEAVTPQTESSPREALRPGTHLRLVGAKCSQDSVLQDQSGETVTLPM
jgi:hypothetical protein